MRLTFGGSLLEIAAGVVGYLPERTGHDAAQPVRPGGEVTVFVQWVDPIRTRTGLRSAVGR